MISFGTYPEISLAQARSLRGIKQDTQFKNTNNRVDDGKKELASQPIEFMKYEVIPEF